MPDTLAVLTSAALTTGAFGVWYAVAVTVAVLAAVGARTPERRRDAREVLKVLVRRNTR